MPRFLLLIHGDEATMSALDEVAMKVHVDEYWAYDDALEAAGALIDGAALLPAGQGAVVAPGGVVTDGPFAETAEVVGGYYLIDVADRATAIGWAERCPGVVRGFNRVEVREILDMTR